MLPSAGQKAPDFTLSDQSGDEHKLSDYRGKFVILYFYPKDDTPGCTVEACTFRDEFKAFAAEDIVVFGISVDSVSSHSKFAGKHNLPFPLLSDSEIDVVRTYGVWGKQKFMGREYEGTSRQSFLIDPNGVIAKVYKQVHPESHAGEVLADVRALRVK